MKTALPRAETSIDKLYRIATASQLTGIPVQTMRAWESRHAVVQPTRDAGNVRLYRPADIERLLLGGGCKVLVVGPALASVPEAAWRARSDVRVQACWSTLADAEAKSLTSMDVVIVDEPVLRNDLPAALRQLRSATQAPVVIATYGFVSRQILSRLDKANFIALATPADPEQIARICQLGLSISPTPPAASSQRLMHSAAPRRCASSAAQPVALQGAVRMSKSLG